MLAAAFVLLLAAIPPPGPVSSSTPSASPAVSSPPRELKSIITVRSTPYCNSLSEHFNGALVPMLGNDRILDGVSVQLDDLNTLFSQPDYIERFLHVRDALGRQVDALDRSLNPIQQQIDQLRDGEKLTGDAHAASQVHQAAQELQRAYDKQRQLSIDLQGMHQAMMEYDVSRANPALGDFSEQEMTEPEDMRNVKSYLRFNGQRDVIADGESKAVDIAYDVAERVCTPK